MLPTVINPNVQYNLWSGVDKPIEQEVRLGNSGNSLRNLGDTRSPPIKNGGESILRSASNYIESNQNKVCLALWTDDNSDEEAKIQRIFEEDWRKNSTRCKSKSFNKNLKQTQNDLVNYSSKFDPKEAKFKSSFSYLVDAFKILSGSKGSPSIKPKESKVQSSNSVDETDSSTAKRFPPLEPLCKIAKRSSQFVGVEQFGTDLASDSSPFFGSSKGLESRPDVIFKTILRSFKKYYLAEFNEITEYKRKRKISSQEVLIDMADRYIAERIPDCEFKDLSLFIAALVKPKVTGDASPKLCELSKIVCEVLYKFNKSKMNDLLSYPQFSFILKKFLSIPDLLEFIGDKTSSAKASQILKTQIKFLAERCDEVLSQYASAKFGEVESLRFNLAQQKFTREDAFY